MTPRLRGLFTAAVDIALPVGLYYVLRATGVAYHTAMLISSLVPGLSVVFALVRLRRPAGRGFVSLS